MVRAAILTACALVMFLALVRPLSTEAQSLSGIDCTSYDSETTSEDHGPVFWSLKWCVSYLSTRSGVPPRTFGDHGLCDERIAIGSPSARNLRCDWDYSLTVGDAADSFRELYCEVFDREYGYENQGNVGYLYIACTDRSWYLYALTGRFW
jgi:hypothetical protein